MTAYSMSGLFVFGAGEGQDGACFSKGAQAMNQNVKTVAIVLATLAVVYRVTDLRRLITNSF